MVSKIRTEKLYAFLKKYIEIGKAEIAVEDLRKILETENKYRRFERFRVKVLDICREKMPEYTDISFDYKKGKSGVGGKWISIIFTINKI